MTMWSFIPAARLFCRSLSIACAVMATIGTLDSHGSGRVRMMPVAVMPMDAPFPAAPAAALPAPLADGRPFVLCVSTLESRKDHATLLRAWKALLRRHGEAAVPELVLVGREGFGAEAALRLLRQVPELPR